MSKEDWLINEVDKWQDDKIIDTEVGSKIWGVTCHFSLSVHFGDIAPLLVGEKRIVRFPFGNLRLFRKVKWSGREAVTYIVKLYTALFHFGFKLSFPLKSLSFGYISGLCVFRVIFVFVIKISRILVLSHIDVHSDLGHKV
jgi:hypothetical protein